MISITRLTKSIITATHHNLHLTIKPTAVTVPDHLGSDTNCLTDLYLYR